MRFIRYEIISNFVWFTLKLLLSIIILKNIRIGNGNPYFQRFPLRQNFMTMLSNRDMNFSF